MNFKERGIAVIAVMAMAAVSFAHLPSANDASLIMGKSTGPNGEKIDAKALRGLRAKGGYKNPAPYNQNTKYEGSWELGEGDTVTHGTYNGNQLTWWAKFASDSTSPMTPGEFAAEGGTSPWVLINSLSKGQFTATTWNGGNGAEAINNIGALQAKVPTWRDGANGAYSITLDDIGAMPFDKSIKPGWELTKESAFDDKIKMAWGVFVGNMKDADWASAIEMVAKDGNEMFNHSMDHTSAADQWQIYYPGTKVSQTDPAVPPMVRGLEVVGTWKISSKSESGKSWPQIDLGPSSWSGTIDTNAVKNTTANIGNPVLAQATANGAYDGWVTGCGDSESENDKACRAKWSNFTITAESDMVTIEMPGYWTGYDPKTGIPTGDPRIKITPKASYNGIPIEAVTLEGGQKVYVAYTNKNTGATEYEGHSEGYIAATGVQWFEEGLLVRDYPFYYNGLYVKTDWTTPGCEKTGCDKTGTPGRVISRLDKGRPGFVAKLFCITGWDGGKGNAGAITRRNVDTANVIINRNIYERITSAGEYFAKGKRSEYFGYPFDAYSETTHKYLEDHGFAGARGGAKSGKSIPGDFFHPFRIDFDAFFINDKSWTSENSHGSAYKVPNNAHVLLGINELVDSAVAQNGYMIRELHAVADLTGNSWYNNDVADLWPVNNNGLAQGGWWGGITKDQLRAHFNHVKGLIDQKKLTVFTPSEAVKYRMTANAFETNAQITADGQNWKVKLNQKSNANVADMHKEEISVIVNLGTAVTKLAVSYDGSVNNTSADNSPRRRPVKMDNSGQIWSVSINPYKSNDNSALLIRDGEWRGQGTDYEENPGNFEKPTGVGNVSQKMIRMSFAGIRNGQIALNLQKGNYVAQLYNLQGRMIGSVNINALDGVNVTNLRTDNLAKGIVILNVKDAKGASVLQHKLMVK